MSPVFAHGQLRLYMLISLADGPRHGYEIIRDLEERFDGLYAPSAGTIYPRLARLEEEGLVVREEEGRKAVYRITDAGRAELEHRSDDVQDLEVDLDRTVRQLAEEVRAQVRGGAKDLRAELMDAARTARQHARDEPADRTARDASYGRHPQIENAVEELRRGLRSATRRQWIDQQSLNEIASIIERARDDVVAVVERAVKNGRQS
ncbi:PadR family transcriptional regulator [Angustibacter sp. McL0619]|uniref:PadR family transcriptional regulator n=1 Tax=Angustibacter sp. McL0619 TaxID=3415676 RepID=UPI003CF76A3E